MTRLIQAIAIQFVGFAAALYGVEPKIPREPAPYFADYANSEASPLPVKLDITKPGFLTLQGDLQTIEIAWKSITSLSYAGQARPNGKPPFARLLTVGFTGETKVHHNAAFVLVDREQVRLLPQLEAHSGCKMGRY